MNQNILAFDLATKTGVAVGSASTGPIAFSEVLGKPAEPHGARFFTCSNLTNRLIKEHKPDLIAIEEPIASGPVGNKNRAFVAMGLRACVMLVAHHKGIPVHEYGVHKIRGYFLSGANKGKKRDAIKQMVIEQCHNHGWAVDGDDAADACAVWAYAHLQLNNQQVVRHFRGLF